MRLTAGDLNRTTLDRQLLIERSPVRPVDAVRRIVAVQAQEPASPYVALWNRVADFDPRDLDVAFANDAVVKATLMRITLHAVHADDYTAFHEAMVANLRASRLFDRRYTSTGLTVADADDALTRVLAHLDRAARLDPVDSGKTGVNTGAGIEAALSGELGAPLNPRLWWALKTFAPVVHAPSGRTWSFGPKAAFRRAPMTPERTDPSTALQQLIWRYLEGFGPASMKDFCQFAMQRQPPVQAALAALADRLVKVLGPNGEVLYDVPEATICSGDTPVPPRLLGMWDSILLAYSDRTRVIPEHYRATVIRRNGDVLPTMLVDGYVAGVWRVVDGRIEATAFHLLTDNVWSSLSDEADRLLGTLVARDPNLYSRYRHWWSELPTGHTRVLARA